MEIVLYPRAAPGNEIRVWIGIFGVTGVEPLTWSVDGVPVVPKALRPLTSVRRKEYFQSEDVASKTPRVFAGVYSFPSKGPGANHQVKVRMGQLESKVISVVSLPNALPKTSGDWFNVLLVSCYHQRTDKGMLHTVISNLQQAFRPHLTIMGGDQVYLDLPTLSNFPSGAPQLGEIFEASYVRNWMEGGGYSKVLSLAPTLSMPDDHEYWNNYPHPSPIIQNAWTQKGRDQWEDAARAMYDGFQVAHPAKIGEPVILDVDPLSFFIADTRSLKDPDKKHTMSPEAFAKLEQWVTDTLAARRYGIFASGQSLFENAAGAIKGGIGDFTLPNYKDYGKIMKCLRRFSDAGQPLLCLTGDVHWGRVTEARDVRTGRVGFYEVISSPTSLVETVGSDTIKKMGDALASVVVEKDPWPLHSYADSPPDYLAKEFLGNDFRCKSIFNHRGNHACLLSFSNVAGVQVKIRYLPITTDVKHGRTLGLPSISLSNK